MRQMAFMPQITFAGFELGNCPGVFWEWRNQCMYSIRRVTLVNEARMGVRVQISEDLIVQGQDSQVYSKRKRKTFNIPRFKSSGSSMTLLLSSLPISNLSSNCQQIPWFLKSSVMSLSTMFHVSQFMCFRLQAGGHNLEINKININKILFSYFG